MSDDASSLFLSARSTDPELEADLARFHDIGRKSDEKGFLTDIGETRFQGDQNQAAAGKALGKWLYDLPRNITVGIMDAALNSIDFGSDVLQSMEQNTKQKDREARTMDPNGLIGGDPNAGLSGTPQQRREKSLAEPFDYGHSDLMEAGRQLRGQLANGSDTGDEITQSAAQFLIPFTAFGKMMGGLSKGSTAIKIAKGATAEAATMMTAFEPHTARFADLLRLTDTNNGLINAYIDYMSAEGLSKDELTQHTPVTELAPEQEKAYRAWLSKIGMTRDAGYNLDENFTGRDYDLRGFFQKYGPVDVNVRGGQHFTDEFKLPNHETFSDQSMYATGAAKRFAGSWQGDIYVPPKQRHEGVWEGRFKNAVDSLAGSAAIASVIKAGGTSLKRIRRAAAAPAAPAAEAPAPGLNFTPAESLNQADRKIETDFGAQLQDVEAAAQSYSKIPGSDGGRVLNTDLARELSPEYRADRTRSAAVHEPASALVKELYARKLAEAPGPGQEARVVFTGGGTGAGKTTALQALGPNVDRAQIVYDTNLNNFGSARQKIDQALSAGKSVTIAYVWRDPIESLTKGALPRAMRMGRIVPLLEHARTHAGGAATVRALAAHYAEDPRVTIRVIDNSGGKGSQKRGSIDLIPDVEYNSLVGDLHEALTKEHEAGRISDSVYSATLGELDGIAGADSRAKRGIRGSGRTRDDRQSEQTHPGLNDKGGA